MSAQRRVATKQRKSTVPGAQGGAAPARLKPDQAPKPPVKPQTPAKAGAALPRESALKTRFTNLRKMAQNTWAEIKKVTWPDSETTRNLTALVIVMSTVLGLLLGGIDFILLKLFETF